MSELELIQINVEPDGVLPSGLLFSCEELTSIDQETLSNRAKIKTGEALDEIIARRTKINGQSITTTQARELLEGDRNAIFVKLRRLTFGDKVEVSYDCMNEDCGEKYKSIIMLTDENCLINPYPNGNEKRIRKTVEYLVNRGKNSVKISRIIEFNLMTGIQTGLLFKMGSKVGLYDSIAVRNPVEIVQLAGEEQERRQMLIINKESALFVSRLSAAIKESEPDMTNLIVNTKCPKCNSNNQLSIIGSPGFLFPHMI